MKNFKELLLMIFPVAAFGISEVVTFRFLNRYRTLPITCHGRKISGGSFREIYEDNLNCDYSSLFDNEGGESDE